MTIQFDVVHSLMKDGIIGDMEHNGLLLGFPRDRATTKHDKISGDGAPRHRASSPIRVTIGGQLQRCWHTEQDFLSRTLLEVSKDSHRCIPVQHAGVLHELR
uniref:Uncharacterized protein n=1 Tax=Ananas comosus var. bracteatus TaxID=296719 RepID=A0A6V7QYY5_ANACO